jgi:hypothetical protein
LETIKVTISAAGDISYEVSGVKGKKCRDLTKAIDALSSKVLESKTTSEFCEIEVERDTTKTRG